VLDCGCVGASGGRRVFSAETLIDSLAPSERYQLVVIQLDAAARVESALIARLRDVRAEHLVVIIDRPLPLATATVPATNDRAAQLTSRAPRKTPLMPQRDNRVSG